MTSIAWLANLVQTNLCKDCSIMELRSHPYWYQRYSELTALIEHKGPPTFFWTVSSADNYWPELHHLLPHTPGDQLDHSKRIQQVINNPTSLIGNLHQSLLIGYNIGYMTY